MRIYKAEGIIIKRKNSRECDRLLSLYTKEYGKIKIMAKGVRKIDSRRGPSVEFFNWVRLSIYNGKVFDTLIEVKTVDVFNNLKSNLTNIAQAFQICELIDQLTREKQENREVFYLVLDYLKRLNNKKMVVDMREFKVSLLKLLGFIENESLLHEEIDDYIESLIEKRLKTKRIYE